MTELGTPFKRLYINKWRDGIIRHVSYLETTDSVQLYRFSVVVVKTFAEIHLVEGPESQE